MLRAFVLAVLAGGLVALPGAAAEPPKINPTPAGVKPAPGVEKILSALHTQRVTYEKNVADTPLFELLQDMAKRYDLTFIIMEEQFRTEGLRDIKEAKPTLTATRI